MTKMMKAVVSAAKEDPKEFWASVSTLLVLFSAYWGLTLITHN